jgi:dihydrodiol dehydrogenase / D-xylose 1-dehydrogenase (NADP)
MDTTRWALLGPGAISADFARALPHSQNGVLHAVGSSDPARAAAFAQQHGAAVSGTYADILARDDVDAVYIGTVHTTHAELAIAALEAGKAVLCEKPVTPTVADTQRVIAMAREQKRPFLEAYKYRFGPLADALRAILASGEIGELQRLDAACGFAAADRTGRLFDPTLAGGAILDVGGYPVSLAVGIARWGGAGDVAPDALTPVSVSAVRGQIAPEGVDEWASADVTLGSLVASVQTSIVSALPRGARLVGAEGWLDLPDILGTRTQSATRAVVHRADGGERVVEVTPVDPMAAEADAVSLALAEGRLEVPEMTWAESLTVASALAAWRAALD